MSSRVKLLSRPRPPPYGDGAAHIAPSTWQVESSILASAIPILSVERDQVELRGEHWFLQLIVKPGSTDEAQPFFKAPRHRALGVGVCRETRMCRFYVVVVNLGLGSPPHL